MSIQSFDFTVLAPVLVMALGALVVLVVDLFGPRSSTLPGWVALAVVVVALAVLPQSLDGQTLCRTPQQCAYAVVSPAGAFQVIVLAATLVVVLLSVSTVSEHKLPAGEYYFLLLGSAAAAVALPATRDLISLLVVLEVVSLPTFALVALKREDPRSGEAALKIFLYSVVSMAVALYGVALVYGSTGSVVFQEVFAAVAHADGQRTPVLAAGLVMVMAVMLFKTAVFPFNAWAPDTYQGAPVPVAAYLSVVSKVAGFAGLTLLVRVIWWPEVWSVALAVSAAVTVLGANVAALRQNSAVRLLAWSSVAQAGYVLVPLAALVANGDPRVAVLTAMIGYLAVYAAMNLGAFAVVAVVARQKPDPTLSDFDGLARRQPWLGVAMALFLLALAGLPPGLSGLFAKVGVLAVPVGTGAWWLAGVMGAATVIGLAYYLPWAARLFRAPARAGAGEEVAEPVSPGTPVGLAAGAALALVATVVLSVAPALAFGLIGW